jgi:hypothetical protein
MDPLVPPQSLIDSVHIFSGYDCLVDGLKYIESLHQASPEREIVLIGYNCSKFDTVLILGVFLAHQMPESIPLEGIDIQGAYLSNLEMFGGKCRFFDVCRFLPGGLPLVCKSFDIKRLGKMKGAVDFEEINNLFIQHGSDGFMASLGDERTVVIDKYLAMDCISLGLVFHRLMAVWLTIPCVTALIPRTREDMLCWVQQMEQHACDSAPDDPPEPVHRRESTFLPPLWTFPSLASAMYGLLSRTWQKSEDLSLRELPHIASQQRLWIRAFAVGGGCSVFDHDALPPVKGRVLSLDVVSLYPTIMCMYRGMFVPYGSFEMSIWDREKRALIEDVIQGLADDPFRQPACLAYVWAGFDQRALVDRDLPLLEPYKDPKGSGNNWSVFGPGMRQERVFINIYRLAALRRFGCSFWIHDDDFLYFPQVRRGIDLFEPLLDFLDMKMEQDNLYRAHSPLYNSALRAFAKLGPNAISGKFGQRDFADVTKPLTEAAIATLARNPKKAIAETISVIHPAGFDKHSAPMYWTSYKQPPEATERFAKQIYVADIIWTLGRWYIYDTLIRHLGRSHCLYWDTDSIKFHHDNYHLVADSLQRPIPVWPEIEVRYPCYLNAIFYAPGVKVFGGFEDELREFFTDGLAEGLDVANALTYCLAPKSYGIFIPNHEGEMKMSYMRMKGVTRDSILLNELGAAQHLVTYNMAEGTCSIPLCNQAAVMSILYELKKRAAKDPASLDATEARAQWMKKPKHVHAVFYRLAHKEACFFLQPQFFRFLHQMVAGVRPSMPDFFVSNFGRIVTRLVVKKIVVE